MDWIWAGGQTSRTQFFHTLMAIWSFSGAWFAFPYVPIPLLFSVGREGWNSDPLTGVTLHLLSVFCVCDWVRAGSLLSIFCLQCESKVSLVWVFFALPSWGLGAGAEKCIF